MTPNDLSSQKKVHTRVLHIDLPSSASEHELYRMTFTITGPLVFYPVLIENFLDPNLSVDRSHVQNSASDQMS
jgi:hypothetical protein